MTKVISLTACRYDVIETHVKSERQDMTEVTITACRYDVSKTHVKPERQDMTKVISLFVGMMQVKLT